MKSEPHSCTVVISPTLLFVEAGFWGANDYREKWLSAKKVGFSRKMTVPLDQLRNLHTVRCNVRSYVPARNTPHD